ncbi:hydrolase, alpha/beta hydrolase fold family [Moelleriella libera RCEF 2490]|uniref:Hydrolase, alpha/beta hydrolase fold family n=1 Tax=Moelleriella libera RCEF 2490 TaxID=1081109 RepID=A0A167VP07_9HYPO|nr:hydrolase, alpha/beta hydrolase fold family [Moelleriella libera RCEF 2490]
MATYGTAEDRSVHVGGIRYANRILGRRNGTPLVFFVHFRVDRSQGEVPKTFAGWARNYVGVIEAIGLRKVDVSGFSMGGCVAQLAALNAPPGLVRSLVLCGTIASIGPEVVQAPIGPFSQLKAASTAEEQRKAFFGHLFHDLGTQPGYGSGRLGSHRRDQTKSLRLRRCPKCTPTSHLICQVNGPREIRGWILQTLSGPSFACAYNQWYVVS